jgi:hypothetical protein
MLKFKARSIILLIAVSTLFTCIDPYVPKLKGYDSLLVVDGLITDANTSYTVRLSRTFQQQDASPDMISDASVFISDDLGTEFDLKSTGNGTYKSDSTLFQGSAGKTYILHVGTSDGEVYESDPCLMLPVPEIESVYFEKDQVLVNNETAKEYGVSVFLDSKGSDNNKYYRWTFDETWKFKVPYPKRYIYYDSLQLFPVDTVKEFCWKNKKSDVIMVRAIYEGEVTQLKKQPIFFIASDKSDRLMIQYNILVRQYSISKNEYDFWNKLRQINETGGDIFARLPFTVLSNIHNIKNPNERVLGYFQVSSEREKRKDLPFSQVAPMDLPFYHFPCVRIERRPLDGLQPPASTWDDLYRMYCINSNYVFVEPIYLRTGSISISKMVFVKPDCANCELTGTSTKPDFWTDLN